jgi:hypothetical protein
MPITINSTVIAPHDFQAFFGIGTITIFAGTVGTVYAVDLAHNEAGVDFQTCCWCPINLIEVQHEYQSDVGVGSENDNRILGDSDGVTP